ncbi:hypothetical protein ACH492_12705 [Streptomyces sp. NPDC019443]|uniref:hypothetical protein n=1 Tax=Streptomyces sp. NPDC019443 TaxID=3365061 RepID=UPI0037A5083F
MLVVERRRGAPDRSKFPARIAERYRKVSVQAHDEAQDRNIFAPFAEFVSIHRFIDALNAQTDPELANFVQATVHIFRSRGSLSQVPCCSLAVLEALITTADRVPARGLCRRLSAGALAGRARTLRSRRQVARNDGVAGRRRREPQRAAAYATGRINVLSPRLQRGLRQQHSSPEISYHSCNSRRH